VQQLRRASHFALVMLLAASSTSCSGKASPPAAAPPSFSASNSSSQQPSVGACPSAEEFNEAVNRFYRDDANVPTKIFACENGWAIGLANTPNGSGPTAIVQLAGGSWSVVSFGQHDAVCAHLPTKVLDAARGWCG
jgi:hypothetical protein